MTCTGNQPRQVKQNNENRKSMYGENCINFFYKLLLKVICSLVVLSLYATFFAGMHV